MYRVRPRDPNDDARSDEDFSDEELVLTEAALEQALKTRVGGRSTDKTKGKVKLESCKATHEDDSRRGMEFASHIWLVGDDRSAHGNVMPATNDDDVDASLVAARASQRKEKSGRFTVPQRDEHGHISADMRCSVLDIRSWLTEIRDRESPDNRQVLNESRFEVVKKVTACSR